ncbi:nuclear factor NF-kappa-B p105 subunit-like [Dendronephthya gigantea]|uniref:nuclear factor NF-kappa-B p105 subunit-like n=1 Tax=Dendronephthya gigantea TaxID=151771 RepID=UPI001069D5A7|nr:nuclear factor NF-kappa-B p105 subunit-like [Dendronephthya gigantea]
MAEGSDITLPNINTTDLLSMFGGESLTDIFPGSMGDSIGAELEILEQPKQRGFRFRYSCEGPSHGGLPGERSAKGRKSFPSVQIINYSGKARIEVTLVTVSDPPQPHAHSLVGKNVRDGACIVEVGPDCGMTASFPNLGVQHVTKKNVLPILKERYLKKHRLEKSFNSGVSSGDQVMHVDFHDPASSGAIAEAITNEEMKSIEVIAKQEADKMNLSTVRLCFQTYLPDQDGRFVICLKPVYSHPIYDSKAAAASELKICRIDRQSGFVQGGEEIFLLCDKVQKEDIEVRFFENQEEDRPEPWEAFGKFSTSDVHRQFAIVLKTPEYWNTAIEKPVKVLLELRRKSDKETSAPVEFTYKPQEFDPEQIGAKRRKKIPRGFSEFETTSSSGMQGSDPGAGPSTAEGSASGFPMYNPALFNPNFLSSFLSSGTGFPAVPMPSLFAGYPSFSGGLSGMGGGADGSQQQPLQPSDQDPSTSNIS